MVKVGLITLSGQGDMWRFLVTEEHYNWVIAPIIEPEDHPQKYCWDDPDTPQAVIDYNKSTGDYFAPFLTSVSTGSGDNDKALALLEVNEGDFNSSSELVQFMKEHADYEIIGEYEGCIY